MKIDIEIIIKSLLLALLMAFLVSFFRVFFNLEFLFFLLIAVLFILVLGLNKKIQDKIDQKNDVLDNISQNIKDLSSNFDKKNKGTDYLLKGIGTLTLKGKDNAENLFSMQKDFFRLLLKEKLKGEIFRKDDVTIIAGTKNRNDYRLVNFLKSIRSQNYNQQLIKIIIIDYGSKEEYVQKIKELCSKYSAQYIRENNSLIWNRPKCINIGIKKANTKYVVISDIDIIFENNYIKEAVSKMKENIYQAVYSKMFDARKEDILEDTDVIKNYQEILGQSKSRGYFEDLDVYYGISIVFLPKKLVDIIGGLDEFYEGWGYDDKDLIKRLTLAGAKISDISYATSYLHQWHEKFEGFDKESDWFLEQTEKNKMYFKNNNSIIR